MQNTNNTTAYRRAEFKQRILALNSAQESVTIDSATWFVLCSQVISEYPEFPELQNTLSAILLDSLK